ncbi:uncharacterized protein FIBRA_03923 [Fibroporia radiculosa]|uniref:Uncharacterized protein n=1 Tax=Fibroporia radiculosa TaxID=599839 RepID=J4HW91_9APHY|nr:uncharacterized protein FIBRA_03923 [Fibroporia radiculosa]CCM01852.1 predicted protein [Fibroporia radiculosa]
MTSDGEAQMEDQQPQPVEAERCVQTRKTRNDGQVEEQETRIDVQEEVWDVGEKIHDMDVTIEYMTKDLQDIEAELRERGEQPDMAVVDAVGEYVPAG